MQELVEIKNNNVVASSLEVAKYFHKRHDKLLAEIERKYSKLIKGYVQNGGDPLFYKSIRIDKQNNQEYPIYYMNRDGFSLLVMGFTGDKAIEWKIDYIRAFNSMEKQLTELNSNERLKTRENGKKVRKEETDTLQQLVEYARNQGSEHSNMLYLTYSKLANRTANIDDRDLASKSDLWELSNIEEIISRQVKYGMINGKHYKQIYKDCAESLRLYKDIALIDSKVALKIVNNY